MTNDYISRKWLEGFKNMPRFSSPRAKMYQRLWNEVIEAILEDAPPVDVQPVRRGHWIPKFDGKFCGGAYWYDCSECGHTVAGGILSGNNFCRNCGADMRGEK